MGLVPVTAEQETGTQHRLREMFRPPETSVGNVDLATSLQGDTYLIYNSYQYRVAPVPYTLGLQLEELKIKLDKLASVPDDLPEEELLRYNQQTQEVFDKAIALFRKLVRPLFLPQLLLWRFVSNPFGNASPSDVATLIHFFCLCRMRSVVRLGTLGSPPRLNRSSSIRPMT